MKTQATTTRGILKNSGSDAELSSIPTTGKIAIFPGKSGHVVRQRRNDHDEPAARTPVVGKPRSWMDKRKAVTSLYRYQSGHYGSDDAESCASGVAPQTTMASWKNRYFCASPASLVNCTSEDGDWAVNLHDEIRRLAVLNDVNRIAHTLIRWRILAVNRADFRCEMATRGGIPVIVQVMREHEMDAIIQEHATGVLWNVSADNMVNLQIIASSGGIYAIVAAMLRHPSNVNVQWTGCGTLWSLAEAHTMCQEVISDRGGIRAIVSAMMNHANDGELQSIGCGALYCLAQNPGNQSNLASQGAVWAIVSAMQKHVANVTVQERGCAAMTELASATTEQFQMAIAQDGGVKRILAAMQRHRSSINVQWFGLAAVWSLTQSRVTRKAIESADGILTILTTMHENMTYIPIVVYGCGILRDLALDSYDNALNIASLGGVEVILNALKQHTYNVNVQQNCFGALAVLSVEVDELKVIPLGQIQRLVASYDGIQSILNGMRWHRFDVGVQEIGCMALANLAVENFDNQKTIAAEGGIETLVDTMYQHVLDSGVMHYGSVALGELACNNAFNQKKIADVGGIQVILEGLHRHPEATVQFRCCRALRHLAGTRKIVSQIRKKGGLDLLEKARTSHSSTEVQMEAEKALHSLQRTPNENFVSDPSFSDQTD